MAGDGVLIIGGAKRIGHGKRRDVFLHPEDPAKVVKVYRPDRTPARMRALRWYWRFLPLSRFDDHPIRLCRNLYCRCKEQSRYDHVSARLKETPKISPRGASCTDR